MSADGDIVREALEQARLVIPAFYPQALAALARLEAAEAQVAELLAAESELAEATIEQANHAEAQRDTLAEALRRIAATAAVPDLDANRGMLALRDEYAAQARAALAETGLEQPNPDWARRFDP